MPVAPRPPSASTAAPGEPPLHLTAAHREQFSDLKLVLASAGHNCGAVIYAHSLGADADARQALATALEHAEQAVATLRRLHRELCADA